jgi:hypothetical protein
MGKPEIYRIKATAYYNLEKRAMQIEQGVLLEAFLEEMPPLLMIMEDIIHSEWIQSNEEIVVGKFNQEDIHQRICDFCKCDIWNRCYHWDLKGSKFKEDSYDICLHCVAEGRGCANKSEMILMEYLSMNFLKSQMNRFIECYKKLIRWATSKKGRSKCKNAITEWKPKEWDDSKLTIATIAHRVTSLYKNEVNYGSCNACSLVL